jgi:hypothetical protein
MYDTLGGLLRELGNNNRLLTDILAILQQRAHRPRLESIHDAVEAVTGVHGTDTTPPAMALAQRAWWKAGTYVLDKGLTLLVGAAIMWLWQKSSGH